jgi:hypothetical protein
MGSIARNYNLSAATNIRKPIQQLVERCFRAELRGETRQTICASARALRQPSRPTANG